MTQQGMNKGQTERVGDVFVCVWHLNGQISIKGDKSGTWNSEQQRLLAYFLERFFQVDLRNGSCIVFIVGLSCGLL